MTPKEHIEGIQKRYLNSDPDFVLDSLSGGIDKLERAFPGHGAFLMEFIQNADDAGSERMLIEIANDAVRIFNDGKSFAEKDVNSVCKVGRSSKTPEDFIGYLGVGFKSVFLISDAPQISSGNYRFMFTKDWPGYPENIPWQIIPAWVEEPYIDLPSEFKTAFNLPLKNSPLFEKLQDESKNITNRMSLFLRNIERIEIKDPAAGTTRIIEKRLHSSKPGEYDIYVIEEHVNGELHQEYWAVFRSGRISVEQDVINHFTTPEDRKGIKNREVIVAFRMDKDGDLVIEEKGTAHIGVYSFLPLKDIPSGLNFLIQADFITNPARTELARGCKWNEWLSDQIYHLIINKCIPCFLREEKWKRIFTEVLYSVEGVHELFRDRINRPLNRYIETEACFIDTNGLPMKTGEAVSVDDEVQDMITNDDFKTLYPDKRLLDGKSKIPWSVSATRQIKEGPNLRPGNAEMKRLVKHKADQRDTDFFKKLHSKASKNRYIATIQENVLTEGWSIEDARDTYIIPSNLMVPAEVKKHIKIVHPELATDPEIYRILKDEVKIEELTEEHIKYVLQERDLPKIAEEWAAMNKEARIEQTKRIKGLWENDLFTSKDWDFITLLSKSGNWLKPEELLFSKEYKTVDHKIEARVEDESLTSDDLRHLKIEFLNPAYIAGNEDIDSWRDFLAELGLEKNMPKEKLVQRIAINKALMYEEREGRAARELPHSEESGGYDIESADRLVEVKGRSDRTPSVTLTRAQFRNLKDEKYFLYIVTDALISPQLTEIKGSKLLDVDYRINLPFNEWKGLGKEVF